MIGLPANVYFSPPGEDDPKVGRLFISDGDWWHAVNVVTPPNPTSADWDDAIGEALEFLQRVEAER